MKNEELNVCLEKDTEKANNEKKEKKRVIPVSIAKREHAEFHNCHTERSVKNDIGFLKLVYGDKMKLSQDDVTID